MNRRDVPVTLTSYWPWDVRTRAEQLMEGEPKDRHGRRLHTLQDHLADPVAHPYVSVAGDWTLWPYGQRIELPDVHPSAVFRIVDTGGHFVGKNKVYRNPGCEPLDICVQTRHDNIGPKVSVAHVVDGDHLA